MSEKNGLLTPGPVGAEKRPRDPGVDFLRGILILLMIMGHIDLGEPFHYYIHMFHMPAWFFISGWFYRDSGEPLWKCVLKKARSLLLPYFLFGTVHLVFWYFLNRTTNIRVPILSLLWINTNDRLPIAKALWFLTALFFAEVIFILLKRLLRKKVFFLASCFAAALAGNLLAAYLPFRLPWALDSALVGVGLLALGELFHQISLRPFGEKLFHLPVWVFVPLMILNGFLCFLNGEINMRTGSYHLIPLFWFNALSAILLYWNAAAWVNGLLEKSRITSFFARGVRRIGRDSLWYLAFNQLAIRLTLRVVLRNTGYESLPLYARRILILLTVLSLLAALHLSVLTVRALIGKLRERRKGKPCGKAAFFGKATRFLISAFAILAVLAGSAAVAKKIWFDRVVNDTAVATPQIDRALSLADEAGGSELNLILKDNLDWILDTMWNAGAEYAYCTSSNYRNAIPLTARQEKKVERSRNSFLNWEDRDYLYIVNTDEGKSGEQAVRPWAHACFTMANAVRFGTAGEREEETLKKARLLTASLARAHYSNSLLGWGYAWQSAEWAENIGYAAWLLWDELSPRDRYYVINMITCEANRFLEYDPPYYRDEDGTVLHPGDTKAEENAWNSRILALASVMFPEMENHGRWEDALIRLLLSSTAMPKDASSDRAVDGVLLSETLKGSNVESDGTVVNHALVHIDYIVTTMEGMLDTVLICDLAGKECPEAATFHFEKMYGALVNLDLGIYDPEKAGRHFYESEEGQVTGRVTMPGENDWGGMWYPEYYLVDAAADLLEFDTLCPEGLKGRDWAKIHLHISREMEEREAGGKVKGQFFAEGENSFISGEAYQMHCVSKAAALRWVHGGEAGN